MRLRLVIANKNYSSWSMRPWVLLKQAGIPFEEVQLKFTDEGGVGRVEQWSPTGKVPVLWVDDEPVWDSLAVCETLAELFPQHGTCGRRIRLRAGWRAPSARRCTLVSATCARACP